MTLIGFVEFGNKEEKMKQIIKSIFEFVMGTLLVMSLAAIIMIFAYAIDHSTPYPNEVVIEEIE
jgi:hypothetical protein